MLAQRLSVVSTMDMDSNAWRAARQALAASASRRTPELVAALEALELAAESRFAVEAANYLVYPDRDVQWQAYQTAIACLHTLPRHRLVEITDQVTLTLGRQAAGLVSPLVKWVDRADANQAEGVAILTLHPSGHVREAALNQIQRLKRIDLLPFIVFRINDWVGAVSRLARSIVLDWVDKVGPSKIGELALILAHASRGQRHDLPGFMARVWQRLAQSPLLSRDAIRQAMRTADVGVRRAFLRNQPLDTREHVREALEDADPVIQGHGIAATQSLPEEDRRELVNLVLRSPSVSSRRRAVVVAIEISAIDELTLQGFLLDRSPAVREDARYFLEKQGFTGVRDAYLLALQNPRHIAAAIVGLGEVGATSEEILPYTADPRPSVRTACATALGKCAPVDEEQLYAFLNDLSPSVVRAAVKSLIRSGLPLDGTRLTAAAMNPNTPAGAIVMLLWTIYRLGGKHRLERLLKVVVAGSPIAVHRANELLRALLHRTDWYAWMPDGPGTAKVRVHFEAGRGRLSPDVAQGIESMLTRLPG
jgi:hypothetical protein